MKTVLPASAVRTSMLVSLAALVAATPALAQRVDDNAVADAEDAFGSNDGGEELGIYGPFDVRGFSPIDAGNVRVEGVYFDRQGDLGPRLVEGNRIRVGPSAIGYVFPAPSGIVDYRLRTPGDQAAISLVTEANSFGGARFEADAQLPLAGSRLGIGLGFSLAHNEYASGNNADNLTTTLTAVWRPDSVTEIKPFWGRVRITDEDIYPIIRGNGVVEPPRMTRRRFIGQHWADLETERFNYGAIGRSRLGGFNIRVGAFRSVNIVSESHSVFLDAATPGTLAARAVVGSPRRSNASTSGEVSVSRQFGPERVRHEIMATMRARSQHRVYGGSNRVALIPAPFDQPLYVPRPVFSFGAQSDDKVKQWTVGIAYIGRFAGLGQLNIGIQRNDYRKAVIAGDEPLPVSRSRPWLFNAAATIELARDLSLYGSFTRGLEEADVAPETAINRDEAPPAIRTRQIDGGVQWRVGPMTLIAGAFEIEKPYYGLDGTNLFRSIGRVRHRGVEASVSGTPLEGLTLVAGGVLLDARLSGEEVASGAIGRRPAGVVSRTLIGNLDWRPGGTSPLSLDLGVEHRGPAFGDAANNVRVSPYTTVDLGMRYRFSLAGKRAVFRLQATNLFNAYAWDAVGNNAFTYIQSRQLIAKIVADF